jgi:tetratricopeptide (TPR) repeat protein
MKAAKNSIKSARWVCSIPGVALGCLIFFAGNILAEDYAFSNSLAQAALAEKRGDMPTAIRLFTEAERRESANAAGLCLLARRYCDLTYLTNSTATHKELVGRALACALQAVKVDSNNATAHACVAVCYAKSCADADIKTRLAYSRRFKLEAEKTIALDPTQDVAYYLLGRWHYGVANMGLVSWALVKVVYGGMPEASNAEAIANFKKAIALAPNRIMHHAGLAMVYDATGEMKLEIAELEKCRALKPTVPEDQDAQRDAEKKLAELRQ